MDFEFSEQQLAIQDAVSRICRNFGEDYWLERDTDGNFPEEFVRAITEGGWLGIAMPEEFGGAGLGVSEALILAHTIARSGAGMSGASAVHLNLFGPNPIVVFGTHEQKSRFLPPLIQGLDRACFGVTEPNSGLNTSKLETRADRDGDNYVINGQKLWTTTAQTASKILLIARTTPLSECERPTDGLSLFFTDLDREKIEVRLIEKMGRKAVDSNSLFIDNLIVPVQDRIGEEGDGWKCLLHGLNPERILIAAEAVGLGQAALERAANYARERVVFDRPIGKNQAIQHPLAVNWMELEAAMLMVFKAASIYDRGEPCGAEANTAKYLAAEAALSACQRSVLTHGGMGYAKEYHVERYLREIMIPVIAPVSQEMIKSFIGERVLGQEKSY
ncbi:MAG: acyl-CoA/acyl-ACP dehydrogenase [Gammaproteobacteria bacterium]|jgi:acyl-CoA dehydrogenase|nr:acyl-CoA/acyl-ACP dehydrogenase [Gammaproteobacteria bacterium]MBT3869384.1 acyl-CoA/acyl-ACP dehydrogenase [Gammaproteobacteria bacterium]MBT4378449.1 acyl-CoA/acyl-ACP dehydrogenase [Gammaproteobacteria bacterium]MBT4616339.1 acyl-CoA/acyl-ACP dehydrogenase [Gammaproteobacteria bacterium]MBT5198471.1 acyl-CoA/acyl-ACP dehydrogenase [Gammaproteobacteria bacterium]